MKPVEFKGQNVVYGAGQEEYQPLPALRLDDEKGTVITCWEISDEDMEEIKNSGKIYLSLLTFNGPLQPVLLSSNLEGLL